MSIDDNMPGSHDVSPDPMDDDQDWMLSSKQDEIDTDYCNNANDMARIIGEGFDSKQDLSIIYDVLSYVYHAQLLPRELLRPLNMMVERQTGKLAVKLHEVIE